MIDCAMWLLHNIGMSKPASIYSNTSRQRVIEAGGTRLSGILQPEPAAALARLLASGQHGSNKMAVIAAALLALDAGLKPWPGASGAAAE